MIGKPSEATIFLEGQCVFSLLDSGSMVSTISHRYCLQQQLQIQPLNNIFDLVGAGGQQVPYIGYTEVSLGVLKNVQPVDTLLLVVHDNKYNERVPVLLGTNILYLLLGALDDVSLDDLPEVWRLATNCMRICNNVPVKGTKSVTVPAGEKVTMKGLSHIPTMSSAIQMQNMIVEHTPQGNLPGGLILSPGLFDVSLTKRTNYLPIELYNTSDRDITIPAKTVLCNLIAVNDIVPVTNPSAEATHRVTADHSCNGDYTVPEFLAEFNMEELHDTLTSNQVKEVMELLSGWKQAFSQHDLDLGHTDHVKHSINLTDGTPFKIRPHRIPPSQYEAVKQHLQEMLGLGVIRPSKSPFSSNIVLVKKRDGSLRFCIDLRKLNQHTIKDSYALPRIDETLDLLHGAKWFSVLDMKSSYWQVEIEEVDKHKTAFTVGQLGFYECNRMPFGLTNVPAKFQRLMESCLADLHLSQCLIYLDDIVVFSKTYEDHLLHLEGVFKRIAEAGLKLRPSKCHFLKHKIRYLGHVVSEQGVGTDPDKIKDVKSWPAPQSVDELRRFLGFVGFYRRFIKDFSKIACPLYDLLGGPQKKHHARSKSISRPKPEFRWGPAQQDAFQRLVKLCCYAPVLAFADFTKPFILHTDASYVGLGAILYQEQEGHQHVIAYASRSLSASEKNYPTHKLEFLAMKWAMLEKFHDYLYGNKFQVMTDNNPLTYVLTTAKLDATGHRWISQLSNYDFTISYRPGQQNKDADALSRLPVIHSAETQLLSSEVVAACLKINESPVDALVETICCSLSVPDDLNNATVFAVKSSTWRNWQKYQNDDSILRQVVAAVQRQISVEQMSAEAKKLWRQKNRLVLKQGVLYRKRQNTEGKEQLQLVLPNKYHAEALNAVHDQMGHMGRERTQELLNDRFYWLNISKDVAKYISKAPVT